MHTKKGVLGWGGEKRERRAVQEINVVERKPPR